VVVGDRGDAQHLVVLVVADPRLALQVGGQRRVQRAPLAGQQIVVQRLAQQGVAEPEAALVIGDDDLLGDRLAQRGEQRLAVQAGERLERRLIERAAERQRARGALGVAPRPSSPAASSSSV
jgi:hypothetical protein